MTIVIDAGSIVYGLAIFFAVVLGLSVLGSFVGALFPSSRRQEVVELERHDSHVETARVFGFIEYNGLEWCAVANWDVKLREHLREYQPQMRDNWIKSQAVLIAPALRKA